MNRTAMLTHWVVLIQIIYLEMAKIPTFLTVSPEKSKMREKSGEILLLTDTSTFGKVPHFPTKNSKGSRVCAYA